MRTNTPKRWKFVCYSRGLYARFCTPCHQGCVHTSAPNNKLATLLCTHLISTPLRHCERMKNGTMFWIQRTEKKVEHRIESKEVRQIVVFSKSSYFIASTCGHCPLDNQLQTSHYQSNCEWLGAFHHGKTGNRAILAIWTLLLLQFRYHWNHLNCIANKEYASI